MAVEPPDRMESSVVPSINWLIEGALVAAALAVPAIYHWRLWTATRASPEHTAFGRHRLVRAEWVRKVQATDNPLLAVQTIRNWIMSASFLASSTVLFAMGILGATFTTNNLSRLSHSLNYLGSVDPQLWLLKAMALLVTFIVSFLNFTLAIRAFIHAGFSIDLASDCSTGIGQQVGAVELERGALHYTLATRGLYLALPLALWMFGPVWMLVGSIGLVLLLRRVD